MEFSQLWALFHIPRVKPITPNPCLQSLTIPIPPKFPKKLTGNLFFVSGKILMLTRKIS